MNRRYGTWSCVALLALLGGCDEADDGRDYTAACAGGKCDDVDEPQCVGGKCDDADGDTDMGDGNSGEDPAKEQSCPGDEILIELARTQLNDDLSADLVFQNGRVKAFQDLDGDGVQESLVFPGSRDDDANEHQLLYLSQGRGCPAHHAGSFFGDKISIRGGRTNGALDIVEEVLEGSCVYVGNFYEFDGDRYQYYDSVEFGDTCDDPW